MSTDKQEAASWMRESDIRSSIWYCKQLVNSGVFNSGGNGGVLLESAVTHLLIHVNDLLQKAKADDKKVDFTDEVEVSKSIEDVTDLVRTCRNAACHISSGEHLIDSGKFTFCIASGYCPNAYVIDGKAMGSDYADDMAIYFGANRLYFKRHLLRCINAVSEIYKEPAQF